MSSGLEDQKPQFSPPAPAGAFLFWAPQVAIRVSNFAQTATAKECKRGCLAWESARVGNRSVLGRFIRVQQLDDPTIPEKGRLTTGNR